MAVPATSPPGSPTKPPSAPSKTPVIPEASQRIQTILLRVYRSLQLCAPICIIASQSPGSLWQSGPDSLRLGLTLAFGATVGIITNRDLARRLAIRYQVPLAGDGVDRPPDPEPFVARRAVIAWAYISALLWAFHVGAKTAVGILDVVHGDIRIGRIAGMIVLAAIGSLQVILLGTIGMLCAEEKKEAAGRATVLDTDEDKGGASE